jgi:predicted nuclease with TOPRIM domain
VFLLVRLIDMEVEVAAAKQLVQRAHGWRARLERCQMRIEELEAEKARQSQRRWELVGSYWPLMKRLREAQQTAMLLTEQVST